MWKLCNICKKPIGFEQKYYTCSVSTCQSKRNPMLFCSVSCFEAHLPMMRHRDAWAEEDKAPSQEAARAAEKAAENADSLAATSSPPRRRVLGSTVDAPPTSKEILVVASKLKAFVREQSGMNTSDTVLPLLSDLLRSVSTTALRLAAQDGRKTIQARDVEAAIAEWRGRPSA